MYSSSTGYTLPGTCHIISHQNITSGMQEGTVRYPYHWSIREGIGKELQVDCGRHQDCRAQIRYTDAHKKHGLHTQFQVRSPSDQATKQAQQEIGVDMPLMHLIHDDDIIAREQRIAGQLSAMDFIRLDSRLNGRAGRWVPEQDSFRQEDDIGGYRLRGFKSDLVSDARSILLHRPGDVRSAVGTGGKGFDERSGSQRPLVYTMTWLQSVVAVCSLSCACRPTAGIDILALISTTKRR